MELLQHSPAAPRLSSQKQLCSSSPSQPLPATNTSTHSPAVADQPHPTNTTTSPASTHVALDQHQQQSNSQQQQPQQMKLRRVLRGDVTKSYIMRPGSSSWTAVTQVCLQQTPAQSQSLGRACFCWDRCYLWCGSCSAGCQHWPRGPLSDIHCTCLYCSSWLLSYSVSYCCRHSCRLSWRPMASTHSASTATSYVAHAASSRPMFLQHIHMAAAQPGQTCAVCSMSVQHTCNGQP